jgi:hypothetical protein
MNLMVNLENKDTYFTSEVCKNEFLFKLNKGGGRNDNCLTIDSFTDTFKGRQITTIAIKIRNSQSNARIYDVGLYLNPAKMGFPNTNAYDWTKSQVETSSDKKKLIEKLSVWALKWQEGVEKAIAFSKPKDAFDNVRSIDEFIVPESSATKSISAMESPAVIESPLVAVAPAALPLPSNILKKTLEQRLTDLKSLLNKGLINREQYENKSSELLREF